MISSSKALTPLPLKAARQAVPGGLDADFTSRWTAWIERGRVHEELVRRRFVGSACVFTMAAVILYAFLRS